MMKFAVSRPSRASKNDLIFPTPYAWPTSLTLNTLAQSLFCLELFLRSKTGVRAEIQPKKSSEHPAQHTTTISNP
jgi:hypothetical protein